MTMGQQFTPTFEALCIHRLFNGPQLFHRLLSLFNYLLGILTGQPLSVCVWDSTHAHVSYFACECLAAAKCVVMGAGSTKEG